MTDNSASQDDVSFTGELTETGMKVAARSRFVSALDRLGGNLVDLVGSPIDGWNERRKTKIAGEKQLIEAAAKFGMDRLARGDEFAGRVFANQFGKLAREQINKDSVLDYALEDLRSNSHETGTDSETENLNDAFLDRLDSYAAQATTEALREKWGRVLAAEVRKPGTFSNKVLRVIDELEAKTALLFERVCTHRLVDTLPKCLLGELPFSDIAALSTAGLILEPGLGQVAHFAKETATDGSSFWFLKLGIRAVSLPLDAPLPIDMSDDNVLVRVGTSPATPIYVLTDVGVAISTILPDRQSEAFKAFVSKLREQVPRGRISTYKRMNDLYLTDVILPEKV